MKENWRICLIPNWNRSQRISSAGINSLRTFSFLTHKNRIIRIQFSKVIVEAEKENDCPRQEKCLKHVRFKHVHWRNPKKVEQNHQQFMIIKIKDPCD